MPRWGKTAPTFTGTVFGPVEALWIMLGNPLTATFAKRRKLSYPRINTLNSIRGLYKYTYYNTVLWQLPT